MCCVLGMNIFIHCAETGRVLSLKVSVLGNFLELFHWCLPALSFYFFLWFSQSVMSNSLQPHGLQHAQASLSFTISWSLLKFMSIEPVMPSNHLALSCPLLLLSSIFPSIRLFPNESTLHIRWPKYWSFSISPSNEYLGLISFRIDWFDLLAVQGTCKSLLQHHSSKTSVLWHSAFFMVQLSHVYDYWKNHSFAYTDLCGQSNVSAF